MRAVRAFLVCAALVVISSGVAPPAAGAPGGPTTADDARTARMDRAAILAKVRAGSPSKASLRSMTPLARARSLARCVAIAELTYCIGLGWDARPDYAAISKAEDVSRPAGDTSMTSWLEQRAAMSDAARKAAEAREIEAAVAGLAKARRIHAIATATNPVSGRSTALAQAAAIMTGYQTRQTKSYYCGPATLQSIDWADDGTKNDQDALAENQLGTSTDGTEISRMVDAINRITNWDDKAGGPYQVQSIAGWNADAFYAVHRAQMGDGSPAPIVEHPRLLKRYFAYLGDDHSGHYQVGRGFQTAGTEKQIHIFEVFNEADFSASGRSTWGPRTVPARYLLLATKANTAHQNIGL